MLYSFLGEVTVLGLILGISQLLKRNWDVLPCSDGERLTLRKMLLEKRRIQYGPRQGFREIFVRGERFPNKIR